MFACEHAGITPDILCTSKGLTGGALPLAATLCGGKVYEAHLSEDRRKTFFHSSSYTANPIACMAGVANLTIWQNEPVLERIRALESAQRVNLARFADDPRFANIRQRGTLAALDLAGQDDGYLSQAGPRMRQLFRDRGILIRPLGNVIYLMPPYCMSDAELSLAYDAVDEVAAIVLEDAR
jgi:adenosylmethionine-8-amino-7-oxononanoate aminotransferase